MCLLVMIILLEMLLVMSDNYSTFLLSGSNLEWPSITEESNDILFGRYEPRKILMHGIQMDNERAYVTMPRFMKTGVPWTLGVFRLEAIDFEPDIRPYPSYNNYRKACENGKRNGVCIVNVVDVYIEKDVLWALDTGITNMLRKPVRLGPSQLISINLSTDTVIRATDLSAATWPDSLLEHLVAQRTSCDRLYVYVSDAVRHSIIVYDPTADHLHTIPFPETISPVHHRRVTMYMMAIGKANKSFVYFTYHQNTNVYALDSWSQDSVTYGSMSEVGVKPVNMFVLGTDRGTNVYFRSTVDGIDVWSWDVNRPLHIDSFTLVHRGYLYLMPTTVVSGWRNAVWTVESNYVEYVTGNVDCTGPRTLLRHLGNVMTDGA